MMDNLLWRAGEQGFAGDIGVFLVRSRDEGVLGEIPVHFLELGIGDIAEYIDVPDDGVEVFLVLFHLGIAQVKFRETRDMENLLLC